MTNASEDMTTTAKGSVMCVCGHARREHTIHWERLGGDATSDAMKWKWFCENWVGEEIIICGCKWFRPVFDWPDSEGWWWCQYFPGFLQQIDLVQVFGGCHDKLSEFWFHSDQYDCNTLRSDHHWENPDGPARFVKLIERNPFTEGTP